MQHFSYTKTFEENKTTYRTLVKKLHPDKGGNEASFIELQKQWEFYQLNYKNPKNKEEGAAYDRMYENVSFVNVEDIEAFYNENKPVIHELVKRLFTKKKHDKKMDEVINQLGYNLGKAIFDLFK